MSEVVSTHTRQIENLIGLSLRYGIAMGIVIGLSEVAWAYQLNNIFPSRFYYLPSESLWPIVSVALFADTILVLLGAMTAGVVLTAARRFARDAAVWGLVCRFAIVGGPVAILLLYWARSYMTAMMGVDFSAVRNTSIGAALVCALLLSLLCQRWDLAGRGRYSLAVWGTSATALFGLSIVGFVEFRSEHSPPAVEIANEPALGPNIVFITIDTMRYDYIGAYGKKEVETPYLDALAADGALFDAAIAHAATTSPSHASMMTSRFPSFHGSINGLAIREDLGTFPQILQSRGYHTAAFVAATPLRSTDSGLHKGFDRYEDSLVPFSMFFGRDEFQQLALFQFLDLVVGTFVPGRIISDRALDFLEHRPEDKPFFAWFHYFDPHRLFYMLIEEPYPKPYAGKFANDGLPHAEEREDYAGRVTYTDTQIGRVIDDLRARGLYDDAMIIVTADHGEAFGEVHDEIEEMHHSHYIFDTTQRVPLIIKPSKRQAAALRGLYVERQVQLVDLAPTILDVAGFEAPESYSGVTLVPLLEGATSLDSPEVAYMQKVRYHITADMDDSMGWMHEENLVGMRTPRFKFICNNKGHDERMYDLESDPHETTNVVESYRIEADALKSDLFGVLEPDPNSSIGQREMDPMVVERLKALGYMQGP